MGWHRQGHQLVQSASCPMEGKWHSKVVVVQMGWELP